MDNKSKFEEIVKDVVLGKKEKPKSKEKRFN